MLDCGVAKEKFDFLKFVSLWRTSIELLGNL